MAPVRNVALMRAASLLLAAVACLGVLPSSLAHQAPPTPQTPSLNADLVDRPVSQVRLDGLSRVPLQKVRNNIRAAVGDPFDPAVIRNDVQTLERLGEFKYVDAKAALADDGTVIVIYSFTEQSIINEVQVVGNKLINDQDLLAVARQVRLGPRDDFRIEAAKRGMADLYRHKGHYLATIVVDQEQLDKNGILIFRVIEGPRVKIRAVAFQGNLSFHDDQLYSQIDSRPYIFIFRRGELDENKLADDVAALDKFYKDHGHLDVRVDNLIELSPDNTEAKITFLVDEGRRFTLRSVRAQRSAGEAGQVFSDAQLAAMLEIHPGDQYNADLLTKSVQSVEDAYKLMGYVDVQVQKYELRSGSDPLVDLVLDIREGQRYRVGEVLVKGNFITKDKVIRREARVSPGRYFDGRQLDEAKRRITNLRLFNDVKITVQEPAADESDSQFRDLLIDVKEQHTGSVGFGVAAGSDSGIFGEITLDQRNFDISDWPESFDELFSGRAFRGGGQRFNMSLRPGTEVFDFTVSLTEPHLFETDYSGRIGLLVHERRFERYDEFRYGGNLRIGRQFGDVWAAALSVRAENIELSDIDAFAPTEIFRDAGPDLLTSLGISLTRTTITTLKRPGSGSRLELGFDRVGALGGDFNYNAVSLDFTTLFTVHEDFLGRRSILRLNSRIAYLFDGRAPTYERLYLGGRTLRGFDFRTVSPKGIRADNGLPSDDPVGGNWLFFAGAQYEVPLIAEAFTGVIFIDTGTVTDDPGFDEYRASVGVGIRLYIEQFGQLPIAFDFGFPILKQDQDEESLFSFFAELPF